MPALAKPIGPVAEIAVFTVAVTRPRSSRGVRNVTAAKNLGKYNPVQTPFATTASAMP
jgi:hypothetical protein